MQSYSQIRPAKMGLSSIGSGLAFVSIPQQRLGGHQLGRESMPGAVQMQPQQDGLHGANTVCSGWGGVLAWTVSAVVLHYAQRRGIRSRQAGRLSSRTSRASSASQGAAVSSACCPAESNSATARARGGCPAVTATADFGGDWPRDVQAAASFITSVKPACIHPDREFPMLCGDCPRDFEGAMQAAGAVQQNQDTDLNKEGFADCSKCRTKRACAGFISSVKAECIHPDREFPMLCGDCPRDF